MQNQVTHVGHRNELKHLLKSPERKKIPNRLAKQIPYDEFPKEIRDSVSGGEFRRIHLTQRKDLRNTERSFNLNREAILRGSDPVSVEARVHTLTQHSLCTSHKGRRVQPCHSFEMTTIF